MAKASDNQFPSVLLGEGSVPTSPGAGTQRIYLDSADHKLKRVNSSGTVTVIEATAGNDVTLTEETTPSSPSAGTQKVFIDSADHKLKRVNSSGTVTTIEGGGASSPWTAALSSALNTSLTGWTAGVGTWTAEVDRFRLNSSATASAMRLFYNTKLPTSSADVQVDIRIDTSTNTTSSRAGIIFGAPATDASGGMLIALAASGSTTQTTKVHTEVDAVANIADFTLGTAITHGTWMTLRVVRIGNVIDVYLNGTLIWSEWISTNSTSTVINSIDMRRFALTGFAVDASFRNLTYNSLTLA